MKNLLIALTLVAVLTMAGTSFADLCISIEMLPDPAPGLYAFLIKTKGASGFKGLTSTGGVHQVWWDSYGTTMQTPYDNIPAGMPNATLGKAADTHFIFNGLDPIVAAGSIGETNSLHGSPVAEDLSMPLMAGMGTIGDPTAEFGFGQDVYDVNTTLELMQVVVPAGAWFSIDGMAGDAGKSWKFHVSLEPEPSTILMLVIGSLCLLGIRIRK